MWGIFRLFLALTVVVSHATSFQSIPVGHTGAANNAVEMFFTISGFLITRSIGRAYSGEGGFRRFWHNRFLRLMPIYWTALAIALLCPYLPLKRPALLGMPVGWGWFSQIFIIGQTGIFSVHTSGNPPLGVSWSLAVEVVYYFILSAWAARSRDAAIKFLVASIGISIIALVRVPALDAYFGTIWQCLPFASGAALAWLDFPRIRAPARTFIGIAIVAYIWVAPNTTPAHYGAAVAACFAVMACESAPEARPGRFISDLSYPVYIIQYPVMALLWWLHGWDFVVAVSFSALVAGILLNRLVEAPIARVRAQIREPARLPAEGRTAIAIAD